MLGDSDISGVCQQARVARFNSALHVDAAEERELERELCRLDAERKGDIDELGVEHDFDGWLHRVLDDVDDTFD